MRAFLDRFKLIEANRQNDIVTTDDGLSLSYGQLSILSDYFGREIANSSLHDNEIFGYLGRPGVSRAVAYFSTMKAGAGFIQIDPESPLPIIHDLIDTCSVSRFIIEPEFEDLARRLSEYEPLLVPLELDTPSKIEPFRREVTDPAAIAFILSTSGSSGKPKCVPLTHLAFDLRITRKYEVASPPGGKRHQSIFFNYLRVMQELSCLQNGDCLNLFDLRRHGIIALDERIRAKQISTLPLQVSIFRQLAEAAKTPFPSVREVSLVGEATSRSDLAAFERLFEPGSLFVSRFSSSEHCDLTRFEHRHGEPMPADPIPLGALLYEDDIKIVDNEGQIVADGRPGELVITGNFLPTHYIGDPERSAEVFSRSETASGPTTMRTGFLALRDFNGVIHAAGRKDEQIKIRGFNVRPSQVEDMLRSHPLVDNAAVTSYEIKARVRSLAAYVVLKPNSALSASELRNYLAERASNYFVPSLFHFMDQLPIGSTGKILRRDLPDPLALASERSLIDMTAVSETEGRIAIIWHKILSHWNFSIDDDFFDVGGNSVQAMMMLSAIEDNFGLRLPLEGLILHGATITTLAQKTDDRRHAGTNVGARVVFFQRDGKDTPWFFAHVAGGHLSDYLELANVLLLNSPLIGLHPVGLDKSTPPAATMATLAADLIAAMRSVQPNGPYRLIGYSFGGLIAFEMARQLESAGQQVSHLVLLDPATEWTNALRYSRILLRPLKAGKYATAWKHATRTLPAALGLSRPQWSMDDAHKTASLTYQPAPLALTKVLLVQATDSPRSAQAQREWQRLIGIGLSIEHIQGNHSNFIRQPLVWSLAQTISVWLARIAPDKNIPQPNTRGYQVVPPLNKLAEPIALSRN